jgi:hypothetical protein
MHYYAYLKGHAVEHSWLRHYAISRKVAGSIPDSVTGIFYCFIFPDRTNGPGFDSASSRNEYQKYFPGLKAAGAYG